jgi:hypothetical protein
MPGPLNLFSLQKEEDTSAGTGDPPRKKPTRLAIGELSARRTLSLMSDLRALEGTNWRHDDKW